MLATVTQYGIDDDHVSHDHGITAIYIDHIVLESAGNKCLEWPDTY